MTVKEDINMFKPYFIVRYGYKSTIEIDDSLKSNQNIREYEKRSGFVDSITILNSGSLHIYYSHIDDIGFALIHNHFLQNQDLPSQYSFTGEVPIILHEFSHCLSEILINLFFSKYIDTENSSSYTPLGEGIILGLQATCLTIKTHYIDNEFTKYILIGKSFFKWFKDEIEKHNKMCSVKRWKFIKSISEYISQESNKITEKFLKIRKDFIDTKNGNDVQDFSNDIIIQADFTEYIPIFKQYCPLNLFKKYILPEFIYSASLLIKKVPIEHPTSYHKPIGSGYISYYMVDMNINGELEHENTLNCLVEGLILFCSKFDTDMAKEAKIFLSNEVKQNPEIGNILFNCVDNIEDIFR